MKKLLIIFFVFSGIHMAFAQSQKADLVVAKSSIKFENSKKNAAKFKVNETQDTLTIDMYEVFDVQKALPLIAEKLQLNPERTKYITEIRPSGKKIHRDLIIIYPEKKKKETKPYEGPLSVAYTIGRHTDQFDLKFKYFNNYGIVATFGNSFYRGDLGRHFLYLGFSKDFESLGDGKWQGVASVGPIAVATHQENELSVGAAAVVTLQREFTKNTFFGPKLIIGNYNEIGFSLSTRF